MIRDEVEDGDGDEDDNAEDEDDRPPPHPTNELHYMCFVCVFCLCTVWCCVLFYIINISTNKHT